MSTLQDRLDRIRESFEGQAPKEALDVMHRATNDLRSSGILDRIPRAQDRLPPFELTDTEGQVVRSEDLLARGPLVVTYYRGAW